MNEIIKCSIGGISFTLEQNAYNVLSTYIDTLKEAYKDDPDGEEILADIEARIAELILSAQSAEGVVARPLIDNIIKQLGMPNEIEDEKADTGAKRSPEHTDKNGNPRIPRRLYRDLENNKLGGVCAGFAKYFGVDATWIRLAMFVPLLFMPLGIIHIDDGPNFYFSDFMGNIFSLVVVAYIVLWFVVPAASSARQKLEQNGERITAQSIKANTPVAPDERERTLVAKIVMLMGNIMLIALKVVAAFMLIVHIIGGCVLGLVALSAIPMIAFDFTTGLALLSFFLVVLILMFAIIYLLISFIGSAKPNGKALLIMLILWVIMLATMTISAIKSPADFGNQIENAFESAFGRDADILYEEFSEDEVEELRRKLGTQENTDGTISRTHIMEDTQVVLTGSTDDVDRLETNISFGSNGIEITDEGKSLVKISADGIKVEDEQIVSIKEEDGGFTMEVGGVKIKVNDKGGNISIKE
ncbi:MAG: PspC domain-containing protein [Alistipes sp.]|nr:PspC domain-containing protein [Alistipes sp.]